MNLSKTSALLAFSLGSFLPLSANEYKFEEIKFDQTANKQNIYEPKDKLDEYIIKAATYSTKFVPLMNNGAEGSEYTDLMFSDGKRILADAGYDFVNSTANSSIQNGDLYSGKVFEVTQYNHAHHGLGNKVHIKDIQPDTELVATTSSLNAEGTTVSIANTTPFATFGGITTDRGEALIGEELVTYVVGTGQLSLTRGTLNTTASTHAEGETIQTYEASGMPLVGINTTHTVPTNTTLINSSNIDNYFLEVDVAGVAPLRTGNSLLCFSSEKAIGANKVKISQNHQFSSISPQFNVITPGSTTRVTSSIRTISGTSADGSESSFIDQGFEPVALNETAFLPSPRLVASKINETDKLSSLPKNKSLTLNVDMSSDDPNLSPALDVKNATFILGRNKINN